MIRRRLATLAPLAIAAACGSTSSNELTSSSGTGSGSGGSGFASSAETSGDFAGSTGSGSNDFGECASATVEGKPVPVTLFIMMDRSGSMLQDQKWANAQTALVAFFQNPESAGLKVALRFFPDDKPAAGCSAPSCSTDACATPLVGAGELNALPAHSDPQQKALVEAVQATKPDGQTPMSAALAGATKWAKQNASPDQRTAVILITDGEPQGCDENIGNIAALAADARSTAGVLTYAIGMAGSKQSQLDQIAQAGGSDTAFLIDNGTVTTQLQAALKKIKVSQIACSFEVPTSTDPTKPVDPNLVNVTTQKGPGGSPSVLPKVDGLAQCSGAAWYYDNALQPTQILLCPAACKTAQADPDTVVKVVLGCATVIL
ncbi:MAG: VWA domain-containing protein [Deltaproteobacteria bacterium]|nr:VWA domain-containing protein [Deltaproteobacteria bacterium]